MSIKQHSLSILSASVVLESTTIEASLLAEACDSLPIIMSESVHLEDAFSYIWCAHQIDLEELSLQVSFIWSVACQSLQEESGSLLDATILKEHLDY
jgi:hypothetical protein